MTGTKKKVQISEENGIVHASLLQNNFSNLSLTIIDHAGRVCIQCSSLWTSNLQSFSSS